MAASMQDFIFNEYIKRWRHNMYPICRFFFNKIQRTGIYTWLLALLNLFTRKNPSLTQVTTDQLQSLVA